MYTVHLNSCKQTHREQRHLFKNFLKHKPENSLRLIFLSLPGHSEYSRSVLSLDVLVCIWSPALFDLYFVLIFVAKVLHWGSATKQREKEEMRVCHIQIYAIDIRWPPWHREDKPARWQKEISRGPWVTFFCKQKFKWKTLLSQQERLKITMSQILVLKDFLFMRINSQNAEELEFNDLLLQWDCSMEFG